MGYWARFWFASAFFEADADKRTKDTLADGTQANYRAAIEQMREDDTVDNKLSSLTPHTANLYIARIKREHGGSRALVKIGAPEYTTHGLRKNAGIILAENGANVPQIIAPSVIRRRRWPSITCGSQTRRSSPSKRLKSWTLPSGSRWRNAPPVVGPSSNWSERNPNSPKTAVLLSR